MGAETEATGETEEPSGEDAIINRGRTPLRVGRPRV